MVRATYAERFRCIGPACEDTCCQGWSVPIDRAAYEKYHELPDGPLRTTIVESVLVAPECADGAKGAEARGFATIRMDGAGRCPMLAETRLCRIQSELGEGLLSHACATYPRMVHSIGGVEEMALTFSCPEAARLVLLSPDLLDGGEGEPAGAMSCASADEGAGYIPPHFWAIRDTVMALIKSRVYPLWQRLFLLGLLCQRLDGIAKGEIKRGVPEFLRDFEAAVATGALRTGMEALPIDRKAQLDVVLRLAGLLLHRSNVRPRFVECVQAFTAGIGNGPGANLDSLAAHYAFAHDRYYEPFFGRHPQILENYLINTIVRCQFPFGKEGMRPGAEPFVTMTREFASLTTQFALLKGLLIGVAGFYREAFSAAHVVHTAQAAAKHFEHHTEFLKLAHELLVESRMDGARGLAILLRNGARTQDPAEVRPPVPAVFAAAAQERREDRIADSG